MDSAEYEDLACMDFLKAHWLQNRSTNPLERLNAEIERRTSVEGISPTTAPSLGVRHAAVAERRVGAAAPIHTARGPALRQA